MVIKPHCFLNGTAEFPYFSFFAGLLLSASHILFSICLIDDAREKEARSGEEESKHEEDGEVVGVGFS